MRFRQTWPFWIVIGTLITFPFILYVSNFGPALSASHQRWSEFGSFYGGVVGPLLTLTTVVFLYSQLRLQQSNQNEIFLTQEIQRLKIDIDFYSNFVTSELSKMMPGMEDGRTLNTYIAVTAAEFNHCFIHGPNPKKILSQSRQQVSTLVLCHGSIFTSWIRINEDLRTIKLLDHSNKSKQDNYSNQRIKTMLTVGEIECSHMDTLLLMYDDSFTPLFRPTFKDTYNNIHAGKKNL